MKFRVAFLCLLANFARDGRASQGRADNGPLGLPAGEQTALSLRISGIGYRREVPTGTAHPRPAILEKQAFANARLKCRALLGDGALLSQTGNDKFSEKPVGSRLQEVRYLVEYHCEEHGHRVAQMAQRWAEVLGEPEKFSSLEDGDDLLLQDYVLEAVALIGPAALAPLMPLVDNPIPRVRQDAARAIGQTGSGSRVSVGALFRLLQDSEPSVRASASVALHKLAPLPGTDVDTVLSQALLSLDDSRRNVRNAAIDAISAIGARASTAKQRLYASLHAHPNDWDGPSAIDALTSVGLNRSDVAPLVALLHNENLHPALRADVVAALSQLGVSNPERAPVVAFGGPATGANPPTPIDVLVQKIRLRLLDPSPFLRHPNERVREEAVTAYAAVDADSRIKLNELVRTLKDPSAQVRASAVYQLVAMEPELVLGKTLPFLRDRSARVRAAACDLIEKMGRRAARARDALYAAIAQFPAESESWYSNIGRAIAAIGLSGGDLKPLLALLRDSALRPLRRAQIIELLGRLGPAAQNAVPDLLALICVDVRQLPLADVLTRTGIDGDVFAAVVALGKIGPNFDPQIRRAVTDRLQQLLAIPDDSVSHPLKREALTTLATLRKLPASPSPSVQQMG